MDNAPPVITNKYEGRFINLKFDINKNIEWDLNIQKEDKNIRFEIFHKDSFPNVKYYDCFSLDYLKENNKLLKVYDNINQIYNFFEERKKKKLFLKEFEQNYFKLTFKSPMINVNDVIIKLRIKELKQRDLLLNIFKEIKKLKTSHSDIEKNLNNLKSKIEKNQTEITKLTQ